MGKGDGAGSGVGKGAGQGSGKASGDGTGAYKGKTERVAVPAMPIPMAVVCCILNFLIPGFGTMLAGFSNFCCSRNEDLDGSARFVSCCANFGIGFLQLAIAVFCIVGWCWSCVWGVYFIGMSHEYYHNNRVDDVDYNNRGTVIVTTQQQAIVTQPASQPYGQLQNQPGGHSGAQLNGQPQPQPYPQPPPYSSAAGYPDEKSQVAQQQGTAMYPPPPSLYN